MKKYLSYILTLGVFLLLLTGCGSEASKDPDTNITISKDGSLSSIIIESFGESYYDVNELETEINEEISAYNLKNPDGVKLNKVSLENDVVTVRMEYASSDDYSSFNSEDFYAGSIEDALNKGINISEILTDVNDKTKTISSSDIKDMTKEKILITDFMGTVYLPGKALYISDNVTVFSDGKSVKNNGLSEDAYIVIYK